MGDRSRGEDVAIGVARRYGPIAGSWADERLKPLRTEFPRARSALKVGVPREQILAAISEVGADLVAAEKIVRLCRVPLLTVRGSSRPDVAAG
jgi:hypothetical protein